jgi:hypothetical protein
MCTEVGWGAMTLILPLSVLHNPFEVPISGDYTNCSRLASFVVSHSCDLGLSLICSHTCFHNRLRLPASPTHYLPRYWGTEHTNTVFSEFLELFLTLTF